MSGKKDDTEKFIDDYIKVAQKCVMRCVSLFATTVTPEEMECIRQCIRQEMRIMRQRKNNRLPKAIK